MRFLAAATRMNRPPKVRADGALTMLGHLKQGPVDPPDPQWLAQDAFDLAEALLAVKTKPKGKEEWTAWRCLMADAHDFQNALHNDAIGLERDLPIGTETGGGTPARVMIRHAEGVIVFPVLRARERAAFDDIFGDGASDR
jgi:hypothetical protein